MSELSESQGRTGASARYLFSSKRLVHSMTVSSIYDYDHTVAEVCFFLSCYFRSQPIPMTADLTLNK